MSLVVLGSAKGAPGVTTAVLALAAVWPDGRDVMVVEADPDGGVIAARYRLPSEPGLATLAVAGRQALTSATLVRHTQRLDDGGVRVLVAPPTAERSRRALALLGGRLGPLLAGLPATDVLVDAGRLSPDAPTEALQQAADAVVLVARPRLDEIQSLGARVAALHSAGVARMGLVLIGDRPYATDEVAEALDTEVLGVLADDRTAA
ncbi:MAG TPA: hypothetical protein VGA36_10605, partial [Nitriliruptorales bacterium]